MPNRSLPSLPQARDCLCPQPWPATTEGTTPTRASLTVSPPASRPAPAGSPAGCTCPGIPPPPSVLTQSGAGLLPSPCDVCSAQKPEGPYKCQPGHVPSHNDGLQGATSSVPLPRLPLLPPTCLFPRDPDHFIGLFPACAVYCLSLPLECKPHSHSSS